MWGNRECIFSPIYWIHILLCNMYFIHPSISCLIHQSIDSVPHTSINPSIHPFPHPSSNSFIHTFTHPFPHHASIHPSIHPPIHPLIRSIHSSIQSSYIHPSIHPVLIYLSSPHISIHWFIFPYILPHIFIHWFIFPCIYQSIHPSSNHSSIYSFCQVLLIAILLTMVFKIKQKICSETNQIKKEKETAETNTQTHNPCNKHIRYTHGQTNNKKTIVHH